MKETLNSLYLSVFPIINPVESYFRSSYSTHCYCHSFGSVHDKSKLLSIPDIKYPLQPGSYIFYHPFFLSFILQPFRTFLRSPKIRILQILFPLPKMLLFIPFFPLPLFIHWTYTSISSSNVTSLKSYLSQFSIFCVLMAFCSYLYCFYQFALQLPVSFSKL